MRVIFTPASSMDEQRPAGQHASILPQSVRLASDELGGEEVKGPHACMCTAGLTSKVTRTLLDAGLSRQEAGLLCEADLVSSCLRQPDAVPAGTGVGNSSSSEV